ncbi:putative Histidinol-phosphate transaminase [Bradyrhizobium sp. ORS 375]|nr:putative Histidinol-phosphate transaminase [Bradyrhizobium sp. ORS 375]
MSAYAPAMADIPQIKLALNETPFGPSPAAIAAIQADLAGLARYTGREVDDLTAAIAAREGIAAGQIVLGENLNVLGLYLSAQGGAGGTFVYSEPGYTALVDAVAPAGGRVIGVPLNAALENDLPAIAAAVDGTTRAVYLVNPHNPSGTVSDAALFVEAVHDLSSRTLVIVDEAYLEFVPDFAARTVTPLLREGANVAVFRTFSKIYGLAGLAIGYTLAPTLLAAALKQMGVGAFFGLSRLSLAAAIASLADGTYVDTVRAKVAAEREAWHALLRARPPLQRLAGQLRVLRLRPAACGRGGGARCPRHRYRPCAAGFRKLAAHFDRTARGECDRAAGRGRAAAGQLISQAIAAAGARSSIIATASRNTSMPASGLTPRSARWRRKARAPGTA